MNYIPLRMEEDPISWNRSQSECELFLKTLNQQNVSETVNYLDTLDKESFCSEKAVTKWNTEYSRARQEIEKFLNPDTSEKQKHFLKALDILQQIIFRAPKESEALKKALLKRIDLMERYFFGEQYDYLKNLILKDAEMYCYLYKGDVSLDMLKVVRSLYIWSFRLGKFDRMDDYYNQYLNVNGNYKKTSFIIPNCFRIPFRNPDLFDSTWKFITISSYSFLFLYEFGQYYKVNLSKLDPSYIEIMEKDFTEVIRIRDMVLSAKNNENIETPKRSSLCTEAVHVSIETKEDGRKAVYANEDIKKGQVVIIETPKRVEFETFLFQCENCFKHSSTMYTCPNCRLKTYCGVDCMKKDKAEHDYECNGYLNTALIQLDSRFTFRIVHELLRSLHEFIFKHKSFKKFVTAEECFRNTVNLIEKLQAKRKLEIYEYIATKPNYTEIKEQNYEYLVRTMFRLTFFIEKSTSFIEKYFSELRISNKQKLVLLGAILMRLQGHLYNKSLYFGYCIQFSPNGLGWFRSELPCKQSTFEQTDDIRTKEAEAQCCEIQHTLSMFMEKILHAALTLTDSYWLEEHRVTQPLPLADAHKDFEKLAKMPYDNQLEFLRRYHNFFHFYFEKYNRSFINIHKSVSQWIKIDGGRLNDFRHSCDANVELIVLQDCSIMGKARDCIPKGTEITINFLGNNKALSRSVRQQRLRHCNITCDCHYCLMPIQNDDGEKQNAIICEECNIPYTKAMVKCPKCKIHYSTKYRIKTEILSNIDLELKALESRNNASIRYKSFLFRRYKDAYNLVSLNFGPVNHVRIKHELRYMQFLARNNFGDDLIYELLSNLACRIQENLSDELACIYYPSILHIVCTYVDRNREYRWVDGEKNAVIKLLDLAVETLNRSIEIAKFMETYLYHEQNFKNLLDTFEAYKMLLIHAEIPIEPQIENDSHSS